MTTAFAVEGRMPRVPLSISITGRRHTGLNGRQSTTLNGCAILGRSALPSIGLADAELQLQPGRLAAAVADLSY